MAFIDKKDPVVINIKLTSKGRELLSAGNLSFDYYAIGDSEIDYNFIADTGFVPFNSSILRSADKNPSILSFIPKTLSGDPYNIISSAPSTYQVINSIDPIGFFTNSATTFITDSNHVKQPDAMVAMSGMTGETTLYLLKAPTYGASAQEPAIGDIVLIKWACNTSTTGHTITPNCPTPYLMYKIVGYSSGSLAANNLVVIVDRNLPNFSGYSATSMAGALIYYDYINFSGSTVFNMSSTEYLDESVLSFLENSQCPTIIFPFWNMSIVFTEEIAGVAANKLKYSQFDTAKYGGFVSYIQNQAPVYKKLGIIHYTNSSPANVYGEGFYLKTTILDIPTIMWHKSSNTKLGARFVPTGNVKISSGATASLDEAYYDLADLDGNVVGKVFPDLKIFVIEDQELLFALSYKSNRSWTLPDFLADMTDLIPCPPAAPEVTWKTPTIEDVGKVCIVSQCYCYQSGGTSSGWISFPVGNTVTLSNVVNTGYQATGCALSIAIGGRLYLNACDYINGCCLTDGVCNILTNSTGTLSLTNVNHTNNYCFNGNIDEE
jgi:hypothetical protein